MTRIFILIGVLSSLPAWASDDVPQLSSGVRANMNMGPAYEYEKKKNPGIWSFLISPHPPIASSLASGTQRPFEDHIPMLDFFRTLPASVQEKGLWVMASSVGPWTASDRERLSALFEAATELEVLLYTCEPKLPKAVKSGGVAWECRQVSPKKAARPLFCEPRRLPGPSGHPVWDCS